MHCHEFHQDYFLELKMTNIRLTNFKGYVHSFQDKKLPNGAFIPLRVRSNKFIYSTLLVHFVA